MSRALEGELDHQFVVRRFIFDLERARIAKYERQATELYDAALVVSEADRDEIGTANVHVVPNGVDTTLFAPPAQSPEGKTIMFTGNMGYGPNRRAARWFAESCFPYIRRKHATAQFVIVGARPPREIRALAKRPGVLVRGFVPSVAAALQEAAVVVAPMHSGTGMQNKVLEAMATGRAVVATPLGLGGIHASDGQEVLAARTREAFIDAVTSLLCDRDLVTRIGAAARAYVTAHHSWETSAQRVENVYESILA
jgi:glycosyltransferase involved in cell wall biosynthesis